jgi:dCTP deaminase
MKDMMEHPEVDMLRQIALTAIAPELEKIGIVVQQNIPDSIKDVCNQIQNDLEYQANNVQDIQDLTVLRQYLYTVSFFISLLLKASPERSSWWAESLIYECYSLCKISEREIIIVHSQDTNLEDFSVYPNATFTFGLNYSSQHNTPVKPLDIFFIPAEVKFDISCMALIGHEVGHIYWQIHQNVLDEKVKEAFQKIPLPQDRGEQWELQHKPQQVALHIEEYLCDQVGRYLLGPAFDFALLKLFLFLPSSGSSRTHPPQENRILRSKDIIKCYVDSPSNNCYQLMNKMSQLIDAIYDKLHDFKSELKSSRYDEIAEKVAKEIYQASNLIIEKRLSPEKFEQIWRMVKPELDGFRPPFETVTINKPEYINPTDAIIAATLYYHGEAYLTSNVFYLNSSKPESEKRRILFEKLSEHLRYAISLHRFVKFAQHQEEDFETLKQSNSLWNWRGGKQDTDKLIVTPTIDPNNQYGQSTVDLRLGCSFLVNVPSRYTHIDPASKDNHLSAYYQEIHIPVGQEFILHPHQFVLATILEYICLPNDHYALVLGRSTWGRLGLNIATATTVQSGYKGCLTLELRNLGESPLPLTVGTRIAQLCLISVASPAQQGYVGKYIGPIKAEIPKIYSDPDWVIIKHFVNG